jgi:3-oxoacyl-[acyl-carrier-protein] synthase-3
MKAALISTGSWVPGDPIPNSALTQFPAERLPLIQQKTGIAFRHYAGPGETTSDLALKAAQRCLAKVGFPAGQLDAILLATSTPDRLIPATATSVQAALGATQAFAFDLNSVCSGGVFALHMADCMLRAGAHRNILVVSADIYSRFLDPQDFATYPYFGDGASAALLSAVPDDAPVGFAAAYLRSDGNGAGLIQIPAGGARLPHAQMKNPRDAFFKMDGRAVYEFAVTKGTEAVQMTLARAGLQPADLDWLIPHQANQFICEEIARRSGVGVEKLVTNLARRGNTASASLLLALDERRDEADPTGKNICLVAFGGGLSYGAMILRT